MFSRRWELRLSNRRPFRAAGSARRSDPGGWTSDQDLRGRRTRLPQGPLAIAPAGPHGPLPTRSGAPSSRCDLAVLWRGGRRRDAEPKWDA
jgi:hypothetical protein